MSRGDRMIKVSTAVVVVAVGAIAAVVSYRHALEVVRDHGETGVTALLVPITVDGLVYVAGMVLLDAARRGQRAPALARVALGLGIGATVAANVLHGISYGPVGAAIAAWPAVTLTVVYELLMGMIRRARESTPAEGGPNGRVDVAADMWRDHPDLQVTAEDHPPAVDPWDHVEPTTGTTPAETFGTTPGTTPHPVDLTARSQGGPNGSGTTRPKGGPKRTPPKGGKRRRTREQVRAELERMVAEHNANGGGEIKVRPLAEALGSNRRLVRELLDEMNVRPMQKTATE